MYLISYLLDEADYFNTASNLGLFKMVGFDGREEYFFLILLMHNIPLGHLFIIYKGVLCYSSCDFMTAHNDAKGGIVS